VRQAAPNPIPERRRDRLTDLRAAYERLLPAVKQPAQYIGGEVNSVVKAPDGDVDALSVCLAFPDTYAVGMSHTGLQILYGTLNRRPDAAAERAFAPWLDLEARLREAALPLASLETFTPLSQFDILGFSLQYELGYTNVLNMLDLAGIPVRAAERTLDHPLVIAGGPCALHPEPLAEFIDLFVLGEAEESIHSLLDLYRSVAGPGRGRGARRLPFADRGALLQALARGAAEAGLDMFYFPAFYGPSSGGGEGLAPALPGLPTVLQAAYVEDLETAFYPTRPVVPFAEIVHDRITIEIMRGCPHRCRFCEAGYTRGRTRRRSVERIVRIAEESYRHTGHSEIGLVSLSSGDYPDLVPLMLALNERFEPRGVNLSLPSLRVTDRLVALPRLLNPVRRSALTLAPEAGTERLRRVIGKSISDDDLLRGVEAAYANGWRHVKLYFMMGLPTETEADLRGIADLARRVAALGKRHGRGGRVNLALSAFVPKPHTPFQWEPMADLETLRERRALLGGALRSRSIVLKCNRIERSFVEAVLARGDRALGRVLERAWRAGCRFDGWDEVFTLERWLEAFEAEGVDPEAYVHRRRSPDEALPWQHLRCGVGPEALAEERDRALAE